MPSRDDPIRIQFGLEGIERIRVCDPVTWDVLDELDEAWIHPKEFFMTSPERHEAALEAIELELEGRIAHFRSKGMDLEAHRLEQKTQYDLEETLERDHTACWIFLHRAQNSFMEMRINFSSSWMNHM
ncbi:MAG: hypothetical protein ACPHK2_06320 [Candidatus Poseidoniaceae archaeon]